MMPVKGTDYFHSNGEASVMKNLRILVLLPILCLLDLSARTEPKAKVVLKTDFGDIKVEIFAEQAPVTAANYLRYVDAGLFKGASFYRVVRLDNQPNNDVKIEVIILWLPVPVPRAH
jgi:peptidyl-prolyl cis-trans isomerase A (cyclophilin A)